MDVVFLLSRHYSHGGDEKLCLSFMHEHRRGLLITILVHSSKRKADQKNKMYFIFTLQISILFYVAIFS